MNLEEKLKTIQKEHGCKKVLFGSGYPCEDACIIVMTKDALSGEGVGYNIFAYPQGQGYKKPYHYYSVGITG